MTKYIKLHLFSFYFSTTSLLYNKKKQVAHLYSKQARQNCSQDKKILSYLENNAGCKLTRKGRWIFRKELDSKNGVWAVTRNSMNNSYKNNKPWDSKQNRMLIRSLKKWARERARGAKNVHCSCRTIKKQASKTRIYTCINNVFILFSSLKY